MLWLSLALALWATGCSHQDIASSLQARAQPFEQARSQAVAVVKDVKQQAGPLAINDVNVKYAALQAQANNYAGLIVEALNTASLDSAKNQTDATALTKAIDGFNGSVQPLVKPASPGATSHASPVPLPLPDSWVDGFRAALDSYWSRNQAQIAKMSVDQRTALGERIKAQLAWPDFQTIAPEKT
jgi:hypothetical protein